MEAGNGPIETDDQDTSLGIHSTLYYGCLGANQYIHMHYMYTAHTLVTTGNRGLCM